MTSKALDLDMIFGPESSGNTPEERAASSRRAFVRSQIQIAEASPRAKGPTLTAREVLATYGLDVMRRVAEDGSVLLAGSRDEPALTLRHRREALGVSARKLASACGLTEQKIASAETPGQLSAFRDLGKLAQWLALDEAQLGRVAGAGGDARLGVRLKSLTLEGEGRAAFSEKDVLDLSESAWLIAKQAQLESPTDFSFPPSDDDVGYPTYKHGYRLAQKARKYLGLTANDPIRSMRSLLEDQMRVAVIQREMNPKIAGATVASAGRRGVVVNETGQNQNVWVRRMTLAHELCHLMWDSDQKLETLVVDRYDAMTGNPQDTRADPVEIRANAFAVAFLAPIEAVQKLANTPGSAEDILRKITAHFGISVTAAKFHIQNCTGKSTFDVKNNVVDRPSDDWKAAENDTVDFFPIKATPIARRGRFALLVAQACLDGRLSKDSAAAWLCCTPQDIEGQAKTLVSLGQGRAVTA